jgi:hypothetical protein
MIAMAKGLEAGQLYEVNSQSAPRYDVAVND